ncbi:hypothetical protein Y032_0045g1104 [Ancylostoma ceylanicum]|uniref:HMG box domain-containing protein n=1 Tax=Ancylostoma ceylanicum TaxID=53326 RepID=A0A016SAE5_9BILA|nr:hypothetical protein Y032_0265g672 [Ancylostoma ceylanicum]EYC12813.1 hypothetical protein Y032_0045g1104 [Ancylostoma ceylanicum]
MPRPAKAATSPKPKKVTSPEKKAIRKKKDPKARKRALSAYELWLSENRAKLAKPGMTFVEVSRAAGAEWAKVAISPSGRSWPPRRRSATKREWPRTKASPQKLLRRKSSRPPSPN